MLIKEAQRDAADEFPNAESSVPAAITDAGCERALNEDRYAVIDSHSGLAWLVCDGMGGEDGGELAAQLALDAIRRDLENLPQRPADEALRNAILEANRVIVLRRQNPAFARMGTTVVAALFAAPEVVLGHAGDSRAYLIRAAVIQQLTTDHTYVQALVDKGEIRQEDALSHPEAHILTRCIGSEPGLMVDLQRYWLWPTKTGEVQDYLLLCTDGLYSQVADNEMAAIIAKESPQKACVSLVELAKERGGFDNITLAIIPLSGQLRDEPPPNFDEKNHRRKILSRVRHAHSSGAQRKLGRDLAIIGILGLLASAVTVVIFLLMLR